LTRVTINPGACGFFATVKVVKQGNKDFSVSVVSECQMVQKMAAEISNLSIMDAFKRQTDNPVFKKAAVCLRHAACPIPTGILKALEVEAGLNLPKDCSIIFEP
jgi:hypothetical protein